MQTQTNTTPIGKPMSDSERGKRTIQQNLSNIFRMMRRDAGGKDPIVVLTNKFSSDPKIKKVILYLGLTHEQSIMLYKVFATKTWDVIGEQIEGRRRAAARDKIELENRFINIIDAVGCSPGVIHAIKDETCKNKMNVIINSISKMLHGSEYNKH